MRRSLADLVATVRSRLDPEKHQKTVDALSQLERAVSEDFGTYKVLPRGQGGTKMGKEKD